MEKYTLENTVCKLFLTISLQKYDKKCILYRNIVNSGGDPPHEKRIQQLGSKR